MSLTTLGVMMLATSFAAAYVALLVMMPRFTRAGILGRDMHKADQRQLPEMGGVALVAGFGAAILLLVGVDDDRRPRPAWWRLLAQFVVAAFVLWVTGLGFHRVELFEFQWELDVAALPLTVVWVVGLTNAFNLIDGSDGVALGVGSLIALGFAVVHGNPLAWALVASCLVAWWFNKPPAKVFIGDGSA